MLNWLGDSILGKEGKTSRKLLRLLPPVSAISAFFNNTPIVAMLIPSIRSWAKKNQQPVSKYLMWKVLIIIASAFGISKGVENSGVAFFLADKIISSIGSFGIIGLLAGVYFIHRNDLFFVLLIIHQFLLSIDW